MKKQILALLFLCTPLLSCGQEDASSPKQSSVPTSSSSSSQIQTDFTFKTSDNGVSLPKTDYVFAQPKEGDVYYPESYVRMVTDNSWRYCTMLDDSKTKFFVENENVLAKEDLSLKIVTNSSLGGSSNEIGALDVVFDRAKANVGGTMVKVELKPGNGISSMNVLTTICFHLEIKPYGGIEVESYQGSLEVDTSGLKDIVEKESENVTEVTLNLTDSAEREDAYGISADYHREVTIPLENLDGGVSIEDVIFAKDHAYSAFIFVEGESVSDRIWISLKDASFSADYSLIETESGGSVLKVYGEGAAIKAKLGSYSAL